VLRQGELFEGVADELGGEVKAERGELVSAIEFAGTDRGGREEVVEHELLGCGDVFDRRLLVVGAAEGWPWSVGWSP
jgi:hypothetical protein